MGSETQSSRTQSSKRHGYVLHNGRQWTALMVLVLLVGTCVIALVLTIDHNFANRLHYRIPVFDFVVQNLPDRPQEAHQDNSVGAAVLVKDLRELILLAANGEDTSFTAQQRADWHAKNPCQSRSELPEIYDSRTSVAKLGSNPVWEQVLEEYSTLHRTCMKRVGNVTDLFLRRAEANSSIPGCKFLIGEGTNGLGNKLLVTVSALLYAVVTGRIFLMPPAANLDSNILCEPFVGTSWMLDDSFPRGGTSAEDNNSWEEGDAFISKVYGRLEQMKSNNSQFEEGNEGPNPPLHPAFPPESNAVVVASGRIGSPWQPRQWFYCSTEQKFFSEVQWLYYSGCIYTLPKLFGSPAFNATMRELFPDNLVLTRLLRSTMLPGNNVWKRFKQLNRAYFGHADRRVGLQIRFYGGSHGKMATLMNDRVLDCVISNDILPNVTAPITSTSTSTASETNITNSQSVDSDRSKSKGSTTVTVFITSLYSDLKERMNEFYLTTPTVTGESVGLVQLTSHIRQSTGPEEDREAMVEVLLLSVSDQLLVTPISTFGGLAQAYGGLTPWFVRSSDTNLTDLPSCERAQTVDTCQQDARPGYRCDNDQPQETFPPSVRQCLSIDCAWGVQVVSQ